MTGDRTTTDGKMSAVGILRQQNETKENTPAVAIDRLSAAAVKAANAFNIEALVRIADLRSLITAYESQAKRLREVEGREAVMREALAPFAAIDLSEKWEDGFVIDESDGLTVGNLRRARSALTQSPPATEKTDG